MGKYFPPLEKVKNEDLLESVAIPALGYSGKRWKLFTGDLLFTTDYQKQDPDQILRSQGKDPSTCEHQFLIWTDFHEKLGEKIAVLTLYNSWCPYCGTIIGGKSSISEYSSSYDYIPIYNKEAYQKRIEEIDKKVKKKEEEIVSLEKKIEDIEEAREKLLEERNKEESIFCRRRY